MSRSPVTMIDVAALGLEAGGDRRDDVVSLESGRLEDRNAHHLDHLPNQAELLPKGLRGRRPPSLVVRHDPVAKRRLRAVERHGHAGGGMVFEQTAEHAGEPVDSLGLLAGGSREIRLLEREPGAIGERMPVEQQVRGHSTHAKARRRQVPCEPVRDRSRTPEAEPKAAGGAVPALGLGIDVGREHARGLAGRHRRRPRPAGTIGSCLTVSIRRSRSTSKRSTPFRKRASR